MFPGLGRKKQHDACTGQAPRDQSREKAFRVIAFIDIFHLIFHLISYVFCHLDLGHPCQGY
jgi:hypothetical protein